MSLIGVSNEPLQGEGLYGYDGALWRPVKVDSNGVLSFLPATGATTIVTQDTAADLKATVDIAADQHVDARSHGYISGAWQKNPISDGVSGFVRRSWSNASLPAGSSYQEDSAVPAGEYWIIESFAATYLGTVTNVYVQLTVKSGGSYYILQSLKPSATSQYVVTVSPFHLGAGEALAVYIFGATLNDDLYAYAVGVRVDTDM